ncbi:uncharacterized protein [Henckelia pumila]|uniref:uncharacterized protein isoform X1 n=1 Tax=Henckelia pumila TaxID=405737 RepID=UPI003C6E64A2
MFSRETPFSAAQLSCFGTGVLNSKHLNNDHKSTIFHLFCVGLMASNFGYFSAYFTRKFFPLEWKKISHCSVILLLKHRSIISLIGNVQRSSLIFEKVTSNEEKREFCLQYDVP